ncbi:hypothetical protein ACI0FR_02367 [Paenochrobactrum sp. BZR 201-1]
MITGILLALVGTASANETVDITSHANKCWNAPTGVEHLELTAHFDVEFDNDGAVIDITSTDKKTLSGEQRVFILSVSRAIEHCSPYQGIKSGVQKVVFSTGPHPKSIDPFK